MTLNDLETGMIVTLRDGSSHIVMRDFMGQKGILTGVGGMSELLSGGSIDLINYNQNMEHNVSYHCDIMEVYETYGCAIDVKQELLWKRDEYKEVTMSDIEKKFRCKVKIID